MLVKEGEAAQVVRASPCATMPAPVFLEDESDGPGGRSAFSFLGTLCTVCVTKSGLNLGHSWPAIRLVDSEGTCRFASKSVIVCNAGAMLGLRCGRLPRKYEAIAVPKVRRKFER